MGNGLPGGVRGKRCSVAGCWAALSNWLNSTARVEKSGYEGPGKNLNNLPLNYRVTVMLLRKGPGLHPSAL